LSTENQCFPFIFVCYYKQPNINIRLYICLL
jgi:hypothetical protein